MTEQEIEIHVKRMASMTPQELSHLRTVLIPMVHKLAPGQLDTLDIALDIALMGIGFLSQAKKHGTLELALSIFKASRRNKQPN